MFRPTHFAILFAVLLCAYAAPAAPETPAAKAPEAPKQPDGKTDLATDATTHLLYSYGYGPTYYTYPPGWAGRTIGLEFPKIIDPLHPLLYWNAPLIV